MTLLDCAAIGGVLFVVAFFLIRKLFVLFSDLSKQVDQCASQGMYEVYRDRYYEEARKLDALYAATGYEYKTTHKSEAVKK